jgi:threonine synthase
LKVDEGWSLRCVGCGRRLGSDPKAFACPHCGEILELNKSKKVSAQELFGSRALSLGVWRYAAAIPATSTKRVTLNEGGTPLVKSVHLAGGLGLKKLFFKVEGQNPTGSFKDRGMTVAVTRAKETGAKVLICASTGNTAASLAAYASRAGLESAVVLPSGKVAAGKLTQSIAHGAKLIQVDDGFDRALELTMEAVALSNKLYLMNSINPYRIEGQKTAAFEVYEQLGRVPDYLVLPVGNAGNISAIWKGFKELRDWGLADTSPKLVGVQAEGASPLAEAFEKRREKIKPWKSPQTVASAIRIGSPVSWKKALRAIRESGGRAMTVSDAEILRARRELATMEGTFVENASASPLAGLRKLKGEIDEDATVVCVLTGHGLKDKLPAGWSRQKPLRAKDAAGLVKLLV